MDNKSINPASRAFHRYYLEFVVSMTAYVAVLLVSRWLLDGTMVHASRSSQMVIALSPMIPVAFVFAAIVRCVLRMDELMRRICMDSLALAGGATALLAVTYGLIEGPALPKLSAWWTYSTFMTAWLVATIFVRRRYR